MSYFEIAIIALLVIAIVPSLAAFVVWALSMAVGAAIWVAFFGVLAYVYPPFLGFCLLMIALAIGQVLWRKIPSRPYSGQISA